MWKNEYYIIIEYLSIRTLYIRILNNHKRKHTINYICGYFTNILFTLITHNNNKKDGTGIEEQV